MQWYSMAQCSVAQHSVVQCAAQQALVTKQHMQTRSQATRTGAGHAERERLLRSRVCVVEAEIGGPGSEGLVWKLQGRCHGRCEKGHYFGDAVASPHED